MTKNTCYFTLHRVRNIDVHDVDNSISGPLDFKMGMPPDPPRGSRLRHSDLITPLINIPVNTNTPLKTSATRLGGISKLKDKSSETKPSLCCYPCGGGGCCLMRPMIIYKVKYTPPKFKMKPLKSKTKCGFPHYGIRLGRKRRLLSIKNPLIKLK